MTAAPARPITAALGSLALLLGGCSLTGSSDDGSGGSTGSASGSPTASGCADGGTVTVMTHESFVLPDELTEAFEEESGCTLKILTSGDAGALTNKVVLTEGRPVADAVFGIDNTFASRAVNAGVLEPHGVTLPDGADEHALPGEGSDQLAPVDFGDVCVNVDTTWFEKKKQEPPQTLDDLTKPEYKDLFVTPGAATSSPGLAFLLTTVAAKGEDGWQDYWRALVDNGAKVTSGWSDAYGVDFTAGEGAGDRPIVLSYASSPPATIPEGEDEPTTEALLDTCFRQVEYAGVLAGAKEPGGARAFVEHLLSPEVQEAVPESMYVYPVASDAELPTEWSRWAQTAEKPYAVDPETVEEKRDTWLREWTDITS